MIMNNGYVSKISLLRPHKIKTTSVLRPVFASPKRYFSNDIIFSIRTTLLIRSLLGSPKGGFNREILLYTILCFQFLISQCFKLQIL